MADFFDKMKDSMNKGIATVSTGSKTMIEKSKINSIIKTLEDEKRQLAEIAGNKVLTYCSTHPEGDIPRNEVVSVFNEVMARNEQIALHQQRIAELDSEMDQVRGGSNLGGFCPCGHENAPGAKFCARCGNKLN